ncbi:IS66 family insertion sequence element accessory protein TnpB [Mesorhizobium sp. M0060]|uniref:IS66 family insertion sequence element accessory protein TnpB n=1 Tax=Mesorhizobium sp. M0060 TaxID=2956866 RepID=UPI00333C6CBC
MRDAGSDPFNGALMSSAPKDTDRIKIVWRGGFGVCLYAKRLDGAKVCWLRIGHHRVQLNHAELTAHGFGWRNGLETGSDGDRQAAAIGWVKPCDMMNGG